jgi:hypothetical protein
LESFLRAPLLERVFETVGGCRYITVARTTMTIDAGTMQQFTATTYYSDGTRTDATATAAWSSSNPAVATVSASGVASGLTKRHRRNHDNFRRANRFNPS